MVMGLFWGLFEPSWGRLEAFWGHVASVLRAPLDQDVLILIDFCLKLPLANLLDEFHMNWIGFWGGLARQKL